MGTKKGQKRKTARRAYEPRKRVRRAQAATDNLPLPDLKRMLRKWWK